MLSKEQCREIIARRVAKEFAEGDVITLGIGLPTEVANYIPHNMHVIFQSENGLLGVGPHDGAAGDNPKVTNAGGIAVTTKPGAVFFDSPAAFTMIRGGHVNATVLGALQVDEQGNLANWMIPGAFVPGMGGAMDLVVGAKRVIIAMEHTSKGAPRIVEKCTLPLTAANEVDLIEAHCDDDEFFGWVAEDGTVIDENTRVEKSLTLTALWRSEAEGRF